MKFPLLRLQMAPLSFLEGCGECFAVFLPKAVKKVKCELQPPRSRPLLSAWSPPEEICVVMAPLQPTLRLHASALPVVDYVAAWPLREWSLWQELHARSNLLHGKLVAPQKILALEDIKQPTAAPSATEAADEPKLQPGPRPSKGSCPPQQEAPGSPKTFAVGETVDYWSASQGCWREAVILMVLIPGSLYNLSIKLGAKSCNMRRPGSAATAPSPPKESKAEDNKPQEPEPGSKAADEPAQDSKVPKSALDFADGDMVRYWSASQGCWMQAKVLAVLVPGRYFHPIQPCGETRRCDDSDMSPPSEETKGKEDKTKDKEQHFSPQQLASLISAVDFELILSSHKDPETRRRAFKALQLKWHPDKNTEKPQLAAEVFKHIMSRRGSFLLV